MHHLQYSQQISTFSKDFMGIKWVFYFCISKLMMCSAQVWTDICRGNKENRKGKHQDKTGEEAAVTILSCQYTNQFEFKS